MLQRSKLARIACLAAVLIGIGGVLVPGAGPIGAATKAAALPCGTPAPKKADGTAWVCAFDDEFSGTSINRTLWTVQKTSDGKFRAGDGCVVDTPQTVSVSNGTLNLSVYRVATRFKCAMSKGSFRTTWYAGSVYTKTFGQAYGRFEVRAKFPDAGGTPGLQSAIWTYPQKMTAQNALGGGSTSEIDIAEAYSKFPQYVNPTVHNFPGGSTEHCLVQNWGTSYHTYAVQWTPKQATFYYDGVACFSAGRTATAVPFLVALTQALGIKGNKYTKATPSVATMQVDWVHVWK